MCAPVPKNKWSWKFDKCIRCGTSSKEGTHKHKGNGLCLRCFDKNRATKTRRKQQLKNQHNKWYDKVRGTKEYIEYTNQKSREWRSSKQYVFWLKNTEYERRKFKYFIKNQLSGKGRNLKRHEDCINMKCEHCYKNCLIKTPIKNNDKHLVWKLKLFKKILIQCCNK